MSKSRTKSKPTRRPGPSERPPTFRGWISTDEDEIRRREWRGRTEVANVHALDDGHAPFGDYQVVSTSGSTYTVEVRSLRERINSCECQDYRTNRLGTCKHIEGVRRHPNGIRAYRTAVRESSGRIEVYLDERNGRALQMAVPSEIGRRHPGLARDAGELYGRVRRGSRRALDALQRMALDNPGMLRVSRRLQVWFDAQQALTSKRRARARFVAQLEAGRRTLDLLERPLLPYQVDGVLHLAFGERALLADDMGLGKTVQAVAACALLRELRGIERVLVVSPASLKAEWEEQIATFSRLPSTVVFGARLARRATYERRAFFTLCNYEQVVADREDLLATLRPDVVILDEAQRIKNWQTKTAIEIKKLDSRYAFVLTGTPLENRIDEIYSIVQFLDPELLGPLFRFNREFYQLDDRGRAIGYRNLDELGERVSSIMLRRRKLDVERELPGRTTKTFFVPMTDLQFDVYGDYEYRVKRLAALAEKRPLTPEEFKMLQGFLACMRMVCDTPYILDEKHRDCPKMEEIERLVPDLLDDPGRKIIVFSEWVRMLELVRDFAVDSGIEFAWHTGSVPQPRRRAEIRRFREDPECRLFLSSETGAVGLNLQVADTVINMDQPWNPARLEQRVARAWRKHQTRAVSVINLVSEDTIEHRMLGLLDQKRILAEGVIDRRGALSTMRMPTSRAAFMERLRSVLDTGGKDEDAARDVKTPARSLDRLCGDLEAELGKAALHMVLMPEDEKTALVVVSLPAERLAEEERRLSESTATELRIIDRSTHEALLRLAQAGLIAMPRGELRQVYPAPAREDAESVARVLRAKALVERAEHKLKAATLLEGGGFSEEARAPALDAARLAAGSLAVARGESEPEDVEAAANFLVQQVASAGTLPLEAVRFLSGEAVEGGAAAPVRALLDAVSRHIARPWQQLGPIGGAEATG